VRAVVEEGRLEEELRRICGAEILGRSAVALRFAARAARLWSERGLREDLDELTRFYLGELMGTCDANEGIAAFLEKRLPRFVHA
jgi:enoyl-CoA hydratase/carnithine racemase